MIRIGTTTILKTCPSCSEEKPWTAEYFHKSKGQPYGLNYTCKPCRNKRLQEQKKKKELDKPLHDIMLPKELEGKARISLQGKIRYLECIDCGEPKEGDQERYERCYSCGAKSREKVAAYNRREGYRICKKCGEEKELNKENFSYDKRRDLWSGSCKPCNNNRKRLSRNKAQIKRRSTPEGKLRHTISNAIRKAIKHNKHSSILAHLPYSITELKEHLENQFETGMSWDNHGEWHIDHIYPQSKLLYDNMDHPNFYKCWALENLRPCWKTENLQKNNEVIVELTRELSFTNESGEIIS